MNAGPKTILGIHQSGPIASAALFRDGRIVSASAEERFTRIKQDRSFPHRAIQFCLKDAGLSLGQVDAFAVGWNAGENAALRYRSGTSDWMRYPGEWLASVPNHLLPRLGRDIRHSRSSFQSAVGEDAEIHYVDHHTSHASLVKFTSPFEECAILVADAWSEQKTTSFMRARGNCIELMKAQHFPNSIGCFFGTMTEFLGYQMLLDEWRVMGMAATAYPVDSERHHG